MKNTAKNLKDTDGKKQDLSSATDKKNIENPDLPGYPLYAPEEDIYSQAQEEPDIDPEDPTKLKPVEHLGKKNEKDFEEDVSGSDLDIPGAELDDAQEDLGSEDEENNHYSIGGLHD